MPAAQKYWKSLREKCDDSPSHVEEEVENELQFFVGYDVSIYTFIFQSLRAGVKGREL
jgi:hypothetical protein